MNVLFLDINGVLNSQNWFTLTYRMKKLGWVSPDSQLPKFRLEHINPIQSDIVAQIIKDHHFHVILSSVWRMGKSVEDTNHFFLQFGIPSLSYKKLFRF